MGRVVVGVSWHDQLSTAKVKTKYIHENRFVSVNSLLLQHEGEEGAGRQITCTINTYKYTDSLHKPRKLIRLTNSRVQKLPCIQRSLQPG